jgi:hypothetical protein
MSSKIGVQNIAHTNGTNAMTIASDGGVTFANSPLAFFSISGASVTTNQSFNKIQYSTVVLDTKSGWDSSNKWWEVPASGAGYYHITAQVLLGGMSTNQIEVRIYKNASTIVNAVHFDAKNTGTGETVYHSFPVTLNTVEQLSADDYIWVSARIADGNGNVQSNGCTLTIRQVQ